MSFHFSKSKYCGLWQCPKIAWLKKYKPEVETPDGDAQARMEAGNVVGDLAMGLFGDFVEVTAKNGDRLDLDEMILHTKEEMAKGTPVICEASFVYEGLYCAVDILRKDGDGWAIYEVKSATSEDKDVYFADVAYQKYVLDHCGVKVTGVFLIHLNRAYEFDGTLELHKLFQIKPVDMRILPKLAEVEANIKLAQVMLESEEEPELGIAHRCKKPYMCHFWAYCTRDLPRPNAFDLYRANFDKSVEYCREGRASFEALEKANCITNEKHRRQIDHYLHPQEDYVNKEAIRGFLATLTYPLYFLDFETLMPVIPKYVGTHPYDQIPFQYSLHYIKEEGEELQHEEFLGQPGEDPRRACAEKLCRDIPKDVCVVAYNTVFEKGRIAELAEAFPDLAEHLLNIRENMADLLVPFRSGWYYNRAMGGSFSIKSVLPALFPNDPELDYHNLDQIHHGGEAMNAFPAMETMSPEERAKTRHNLLEYCKLDTYAMVKVWEKLKEAAEE